MFGKMKKYYQLYFHITVALVLIAAAGACDYLDVVPDNIPTVEENFNMRATAERYLFTCYSYMSAHGSAANDPAVSSGDDYWYFYQYQPSFSGTYIARGLQNVASPYLDHWNGNKFKGIRDCNIFLESIDRVPDMEQWEKERWIAEVKFLKAYYHFWLFREYGAIPVIRENLPITAGVDEVRTYREPVDTCVNYMVQLLDEAAPFLPEKIDLEASELGRITKPICLSLKALILVTAASPLFNGGSSDYADIVDNRGVHLFNVSPDERKWVRAAEACAEAVALSDQYFQLYTYESGTLTAWLTVSSELTKTLVSIRGSASERWNGEVIWANTQSQGDGAQQRATPFKLTMSKYPSSTLNYSVQGWYSVPIKHAELFYSRHGLPIEQDNTYDYAGRYGLRVATNDERYYLQPGYTTVGLHFDREPRFYASLTFDGGLWLGQGATDDKNQYLIQCKAGQYQAAGSQAAMNITGYWPKKLVNHRSQPSTTGSGYTIIGYPWPLIRLADLYLLYAEALNEAYGPQGDATGTEDAQSPYTWLNKVRERAGIPSVGEAWEAYAKNKSLYTTKEGLREIIQQERLIELAFEGHRFWDLRRWRRAHIELNNPITGWDYGQSDPQYYYRPVLLYNQAFRARDYLWPLSEATLLQNPNLVQNYGWE
jgi:hypothetical protein